ncbi:MAG: alpha/beta hydrolase [Bacteroidales bacterium]|nr:alpha/beta hydrolase [Bacteroidales bacterium]
MRTIKLFIFFLLALPLSAQERIWEGTSCTHSHVTLTEYLPEGEAKAAVIVCPGGSYHWHDVENEGTKVAQWLSSEDIAAYVLKYRVAGKVEFGIKYRTFLRGHRYPDMLCDLQRAIQLLRERYEGPVGVMGFSAGGHLVMSGAEFFDTNFLSQYGIVPEVSLRPDFAATIYPVVSMTDKSAHKRSRLGLLGEWSVLSPSLRDSLSLEKHVREDTPPVFLLNCADDPIVNSHNSELLDSALSARHVPHLYIQYPSGGHGFGAEPSKQNEYTQKWQQAFIDWLWTLNLENRKQ